MILALTIALLAGQGGEAQRLMRALAADPPPPHGWETISAESRALISEATSLEVFRLGSRGLGPILGLGCLPPSLCVQVGDSLWFSWDVAERERGDWPLDVFGRTAGTLNGLLHYPVLGKAAKVDGTLMARVRDTLSAGRYGSYTKFCGEIAPAVGYRFTGPRGSAEVLICFRCREADVVMGQRSERLQIDLLWKPLLQLAIESFPDDLALAEALTSL